MGTAPGGPALAVALDDAAAEAVGGDLSLADVMGTFRADAGALARERADREYTSAGGGAGEEAEYEVGALLGADGELDQQTRGAWGGEPGIVGLTDHEGKQTPCDEG